METWISVIVDVLQELVTLTLALIAPVLAAALTAYLVQLARRYGLDLDAERQARLEKIIQDLLLRVEEWAHLQTRLTGHKPTITQKQTRFADLALLAGFTLEQATVLRDQELPKVRALLGGVTGGEPAAGN